MKQKSFSGCFPLLAKGGCCFSDRTSENPAVLQFALRCVMPASFSVCGFSREERAHSHAGLQVRRRGVKNSVGLREHVL